MRKKLGDKKHRWHWFRQRNIFFGAYIPQKQKMDIPRDAKLIFDPNPPLRNSIDEKNIFCSFSRSKKIFFVSDRIREKI